MSTGALRCELAEWAILQHPWEGSQGHHWDWLCRPAACEFTSGPPKDPTCRPQGLATWDVIGTISEAPSHLQPLMLQAGSVHAQTYLRTQLKSYLGYGELFNPLSIIHLYSQKIWIKRRARHLYYTREQGKYCI